MPPIGSQELARFDVALGTWRSREPGAGLCPTGREVSFDETVSFERFEDWVLYRQQAVECGTGVFLHQETGVFRSWSAGQIELSLVMNSGRMEQATARFEGDVLVTECTDFIRDRRGARGMRRTFHFQDGRCSKELYLATLVWPELRRHMWTELERVDGPR